MNAIEAVRTALITKYADFSGRAARAEYWYFTGFTVLVLGAAMVVDAALGNQIVSFLALLALILPTIAVTVRRLHDIDRSGWWDLINLVPVIGWLTILVFALQRGTSQGNRFGPMPQY